jgi:hypothetical protein
MLNSANKLGKGEQFIQNRNFSFKREIDPAGFELQNIRSDIESSKIADQDMAKRYAIAGLDRIENNQEVKELQQIEKILAEGLEEYYLNLRPDKQLIFKQAGEEAALQIEQVLAKDHENTTKIAEIIKNWLEIIPEFGSSYIKQESKIKAEKIKELLNR